MQQAALLAGTELERCRDEALEQRMSAVGAALELGVELGTQMEVPAGQLYGLHQMAVRAGAGNDQAGVLHLLPEVVVELVAVAVTPSWCRA